MYEEDVVDMLESIRFLTTAAPRRIFVSPRSGLRLDREPVDDEASDDDGVSRGNNSRRALLVGRGGV